MKKIGFISHYKNLLFFALKRYESNNYQSMREYFASVLVIDLKDFVDLNEKKNT